MKDADAIKESSTKALIGGLRCQTSKAPDALEGQESVALADKTRPQVEGALSAEPKKREISSDQAELLLSNLKSRFFTASWGYERTPDEWAKVEKVLRENPKALFSIQRLKDTGGEPALVSGGGSVFCFGDTSLNPRKMNYNDAVAQARELGVNMRSDKVKVSTRKGYLDVYIDIDREAWSLHREEVILKESHGKPNGKRSEIIAKFDEFRCTIRDWRAWFLVKIG